jgi:pimeloyl-ACP methyl ester carboxylesterase
MQTLTDIPAAERRLDLTGVSTALLEGGDGPPLVCLHGPGANASHWDCVIRDFASTNRVVAPDLPGLGESVLANGKPTAALVVDWLAELISETCNEAPTVIGNGVGGAIAVRFATERAGECARLVLVDSLGLRAFQPAPQFGRALNAFVADPTEATHEELWRHCAHDLPRLQMRMGAEWESFAAYNLDRAQTPEVMMALGALMGDFGLPAIPASELARINFPTSLIWGRHDLATPVEVAEQVSARYDWPLAVIEDCGDDPPVEQPEAFVAALREQLDQEAAR